MARDSHGQFTKDAPDQAPDQDGLVRDEDGGLIDPPTIPSFERELQEAHATGDDLAVQEVQDRYTEAREDKARALAQREQDNGSDDDNAEDPSA